MGRLLLLALGSELVYLGLALWSRTLKQGPIVEGANGDGATLVVTLSLAGSWVVLAALYLLSVRRCFQSPEAVGRGFVLMSAVAFRLTLFLGGGFDPAELTSRHSPLERLEARFEEVDRLIPEPYRELHARPSQTATMILLDTAAIGLLTTILWASGASSGLSLVYAWNPFVVLAVAGLGRLELVAAVAALWAVKELITVTHEDSGTKLLAGGLLGFALGGALWFLPVVWLLLSELGIGAILGVLLGAALWGLEAGFDPSRIAEVVGWQPGPGASLQPAMNALAELTLTRDWRLVSAALCAAFFVWSVTFSIRVRRRVEHRPLPERWAHRLRLVLASVGGLLLIAPGLSPVDWLALCAFAPLAIHPSLKTNPGWLLFPLTAPLAYWASGGFTFVWGFAQYFVPFAVLVFFALGRDKPED